MTPDEQRQAIDLDLDRTFARRMEGAATWGGLSGWIRVKDACDAVREHITEADVKKARELQLTIDRHCRVGGEYPRALNIEIWDLQRKFIHAITALMAKGGPCKKTTADHMRELAEQTHIPPEIRKRMDEDRAKAEAEMDGGIPIHICPEHNTSFENCPCDGEAGT